jgi:predicted small secreted protein
LAELAQAEGGTAVALLRHIEHRQEQAAISENTAVRYLKEMNFSYTNILGSNFIVVRRFPYERM